MRERRAGVVGGVVGALVTLIALATVPALAAAVGDPLGLGVTNVLHNSQTTLRGLGDEPNLKVKNQSTAPALALITDASAPPMEVSSSVRVNKLNADRLDGRHANRLLRSGFASTDDAPDANGDIVSFDFRVPGRGYLIMSGSLEVMALAGQHLATCRLQVELADVPGSTRSVDLEVHGRPVPPDPDPEHTDDQYEICSTEGGMVVGPGTYEVALNATLADAVAGWNSFVEFHGASVWAIWVPFDENGGVPVP